MIRICVLERIREMMMTRVYQRKNKPLEDLADFLLDARTYEVTVQCPVCKTIESLELTWGSPLRFGQWDYCNGAFLHKRCNYPFLFDMLFYDYSWCHHPARILRWS